MTTEPSNPRPNPYVGARPYRQGETLYGRSREQRRLLNQLIADRIVLLNSPSGAGKTSLIQAALIPDLTAEGFLVLPVARVNADLPAELAGRAGVNRYLLSLLVGLDEHQSAQGAATPLETLATTSLDDYLAQVEQANPQRNLVLILDQFEEIVTIDPTDDAGRQAFFAGLAGALRNPRRWALFAMREEYVARLDPLVRPVPTRLAMRFRLELLSPEGALEAIQRPAVDAGVAFEDSAARILVDDLRTVRVQQEDGRLADTPGNSVEPVQLQVVCQRLWSGLRADDAVIGEDDVRALGDVSQALKGYYDQQVAAVAGGQVEVERAIRDWFETRLITPQGIRAQIAREPEATGGLDNALISELDNRRLVRSERRRGVDWFELAHDRLIQPVLASNAAWRATRLAAWQQRAILWDQQGRPVDLLLKGGLLAEAEQQAASAPQLTPLDRAFLDAGRERRRQHRLRATLSVVGVLAAAALLATVWLALRASNQKRIEVRREESARVAALSASMQYSEPDLAALLAVQSLNTEQSRTTVTALVDILNGNPRLERVIDLSNLVTGTAPMDGHVAVPVMDPGSARVRAAAVDEQHDRLAAAVDSAVYLIDRPSGRLLGEGPLLTEDGSSVTDLAFSPDGRQLAAADLDGRVTTWDLSADPPARQTVQAVRGVANGLAFDPTGDRLAVIGKNSAAVWQPGDNLAAAQPTEWLAGTATLSLGWSPDGALLAVGDDRGAVALLNGGRAPIRTLTGPPGPVKALAFSPDGRWLAAAIETDSADLGQSVVLVWPLEGEDAPARFTHDSGTVTSLAFVGNGAALAVGSDDNSIRVWDLASGLPEDPPLRGSRQNVTDMAYSPELQTLASGDGQGRVFLWRFDTPNRLATPLLGHTDQVYTVDFSPDGALLASGGKDRSVRLWNVSSGESQALGSHDGSVREVAFSPDGALLASASEDEIKLWQLGPQPALATTLSGPGAQSLGDIQFSPDGRLLAASDTTDGSIYLWELAGEGQATARRLATDLAGPLSLAFAPDGDILYAANSAGQVHGWRTSGDAAEAVLSIETGDGAPLLDLAASPDGLQLTAAGANSAVYVWNREDGEPYGIGVLAGHTLPATGVAFSGDSAQLASVSHDGDMILWDFGGQYPLGVFRGHDGPINAVAFSPDGRLAATAGDDHTVLLWQASLDQWEQAACRLAARPLTASEIDRFLGYRQPAVACLE